MQKMFTIGWRTNWRAGDARGESQRATGNRRVSSGAHGA